MLLIAYDTFDFHKIKSVLNKLKITDIKFRELSIGRNLSLDNISSNNKDNILLNVVDQIDVNKHLKDISNVLVCGDSISMLGVAIAAFNRKIPIIHLGAGYRTYDPYFPNEIYRQSIARFVSIHLCTSTHNAKNLTSEGIRSTKYVVGNPALDLIPNKNITNQILLLFIDDAWNRAIYSLEKENPTFIFKQCLNNFPTEYFSEASMIISQKTELQEVACYLHRPMIILGKTTDRPESLWCNVTRCANPDYLSTAFKKCLEKSTHLDYKCPYGDGKSAETIIEILKKELQC